MTKLITFLTGIISFFFFGYCFLIETVDSKEQNLETPRTTEVYKSDDSSEITKPDVTPQGTGGPEKVYSEEAKEYFREITLKTEFDGDRKNAFVWTTDMKIFVDGQKSEYLMNELRKIVAELNVIIDPINIKIVSNKSESNYIVYFGSHTDFKAKYKLYSPQRLDNNWGYFEVSSNSGKMYVDLVRNGDVESHKHLLREELTQSLGLFNDSWDYPESIFYQGWTTTTEYAPIDRELIDMLYNN